MSAEALCMLDDLKEKDARGFVITLPNGQALSVIVVRDQENIFVYRNHCPHTGIPLEWQPDRFFDLGGAFLQCATHGALFRPEDGYCVRGPCAGESLQAIPFKIKNKQIVIQQ